MIRNLLDSFSIDNNNDDYALDFMIILFSDQFLVMSELLFNDRKLTITELLNGFCFLVMATIWRDFRVNKLCDCFEKLQ
ncbi:hypothetical protein DERP_006713 [Dermatophagoides pteronyssinus]|uniref:Uncharacterized protein n=1 Tax=Dermatophagoides pteronyssinus TaxID=6956 RepID=A0ABQ8IRS3_DERPT|nr:hypothetical protein DERP_006713 [Dermatophagoides pteronyssinus]